MRALRGEGGREFREGEMCQNCGVPIASRDNPNLNAGRRKLVLCKSNPWVKLSKQVSEWEHRRSLVLIVYTFSQSSILSFYRLYFLPISLHFLSIVCTFFLLSVLSSYRLYFLSVVYTFFPVVYTSFLSSTFFFLSFILSFLSSILFFLSSILGWDFKGNYSSDEVGRQFGVAGRNLRE